MARSHAQLLTSIWNDADFLALSAGAQRLYMLLLSQQNLSHCGLIPTTVKRWASKAQQTDNEDVEAFLVELEDRRYVISDDVTEESLVRTLMRGDGVYKQLNVTKSACKDAKAITSPKLRGVLVCEIARILTLEGVTEAVARELTTLSEALAEPTGTPPEALAEPTRGGAGRGSVTEGTSDSPAPSPSPTPAPVPAAYADDPTSTLLAEHSAAYDQPPPPSALTPVKREIMRLVAEHVPPERISAGLARMRDKRLAASLLPQLVTEASQTTRSTTDERVAAGAALVARYEEFGQ